MFSGTVVAQLPELDYCDYVFDLWGKVGICSSGMAGPIPLSWGQVNDWCVGNGLDLWPTERALIVRLSEAYVSKLNKSDHPQELSPMVYNENGEVDSGKQGVVLMAARKSRKQKREALKNPPK